MTSTRSASRKSRTAPAPFLKIKQYLRKELFAGRWAPGSLMPSEAELVKRFGVSRMTVIRALRELQTEGLVERVQGAGTYASQPRKFVAMLQIRDLHEEIESRGHRHHSVVVLSRTETATARMAGQLGIPDGGSVFHTLIVHFEDGAALQCEDRFVNPECAPGYLDVDFTQTTPTRYLLQVSPYVDAQFSIEAAHPTAQEAKLLDIARTDPCLVVVRRTTGLHAPAGAEEPLGITIARLVHPGARYLLQGTFLA